VIPVPPSPQDRLLDDLREHSGYRIHRAPWGWTAYRPGQEGDVQAKTLDELAAKIMPPAGRPPLPGRAPGAA
jgi:hypothetical protein